MKRRDAVRATTLMMFGIALQQYDALRAQGGLLTVDLNQWSHIAFKYNGKQIAVSMSEVFESLKMLPAKDTTQTQAGQSTTK